MQIQAAIIQMLADTSVLTTEVLVSIGDTQLRTYSTHLTAKV